MNSKICLDEKYSTTRLNTKEIPEIVTNPEDKFETVLFLPKGENRKGEGGLRTKGYFKKSFEDKPLVSIITVVFNGEKYLEQTIQSVINQIYDNVEYIIIDGGSNDDTLAIIKKYEDQIDYWVSEKDSGIYDAMNKGISLSLGEKIGIINADDWYETNALTQLQINLECIEYGLLRLIKSELEYQILRKSDIFLNESMIPHPTSFVSKSIYKKLGFYNTNYKFSSDYEFMLRAKAKNIKFCTVNKILGNFRLDGVSSSSEAFLETTLIKYQYGCGITSFDLLKLRLKLFLKNALISFKKLLK